LGIAVVHGSALLTRSKRFDRLVAAGPVLSAAVISVVGAVMIGQGMVAQNIHVGVWLVASLTLIAILAYSITPTHSHEHEVEHA
jgi:hypothetical protein